MPDLIVRRNTVWRRAARVFMLTAIFAVYISLGYVLLGIPRDAWRDILIYVEFFLTFAFYSAYWLFRKSDLQQYGRLDQWVRVSCYIYSVFFCPGTMYFLTLLGAHIDR